MVLLTQFSANKQTLQHVDFRGDFILQSTRWRGDTEGRGLPYYYIGGGGGGATILMGLPY